MAHNDIIPKPSQNHPEIIPKLPRTIPNHPVGNFQEPSQTIPKPSPKPTPSNARTIPQIPILSNAARVCHPRRADSWCAHSFGPASRGAGRRFCGQPRAAAAGSSICFRYRVSTRLLRVCCGLMAHLRHRWMVDAFVAGFGSPPTIDDRCGLCLRHGVVDQPTCLCLWCGRTLCILHCKIYIGFGPASGWRFGACQHASYNGPGPNDSCRQRNVTLWPPGHRDAAEQRPRPRSRSRSRNRPRNPPRARPDVVPAAPSEVMSVATPSRDRVRGRRGNPSTTAP